MIRLFTQLNTQSEPNMKYIKEDGILFLVEHAKLGKEGFEKSFTHVASGTVKRAWVKIAKAAGIVEKPKAEKVEESKPETKKKPS